MALAPAPKRIEPVPCDLFAERRYRSDVAWHCVVGDMSTHHTAKPFSLLGDGPISASPKQVFHLTQLGRYPFRDRLAPQREPSLPRLRAYVREAEKGERFGPPETAPSAVLGGEAPELNQTGFLGVQFQAELGETLRQVLVELLGI